MEAVRELILNPTKSVLITAEELKETRGINRDLFAELFRSVQNDPNVARLNKIWDGDLDGGVLPGRYTTGLEYRMIMEGVLGDAKPIILHVKGVQPSLVVDSVGEYDVESKLRKRFPWIVNVEPFLAVAGKKYEEPREMYRVSVRSIQELSSLYKNLATISSDWLIYNYDGYYSYHRKWFRENDFSMGQWVDVSKKVHITGDEYEINVKDLRNVEAPQYEPSVVMCWDTETKASEDVNRVPMWTNMSDQMPMACYEFYFESYLNRPILTVALTSVKPDLKKYDKRHRDIPALFVLCSNTKDIGFRHSVLVSRFKPQFIVGFNDTGYDWNWVWNALRRDPKTTEAEIANWHLNLHYCSVFRDRNIKEGKITEHIESHFDVKLGADRPSVKPAYVSGDGYIEIDMMLMMMRMFPKSETSNSASLKYFVAKSELEDIKIDLSQGSPIEKFRINDDNYGELRRIFMEYDKTGQDYDGRIGDALYYCFNDSRLCWKMLDKQKIIPERRSYCDKMFLSLQDNIWMADGKRVTNAAAHLGYKIKEVCGYEVVWNLIRKQPSANLQKIKGAWVVRPKLGFHLLEPIAGIDVASLYPSLIHYYNLCPSKMIMEFNAYGGYDREATIKRAFEIGINNLHEITIHDSGEEIIFYTLMHRDDDTLKGVFPLMMKQQFAARLQLKTPAKVLLALVGNLAKGIEGCVKEACQTIRKKVKDASRYEWLLACEAMSTSEFVSNKSLMVKLTFQAVFEDKAQNTAKVLMNTAYGTYGSETHPLYNRYLASAVTHLGAQLMRQVHKFCARHGYVIYYGDTDSIYASRQTKNGAFFYADLHDKIRQLRVDFGDQIGSPAHIGATKPLFESLIDRATTDAADFTKLVNSFVKDINFGSDIIQFAFEEILCPTAFLGKKKYFGLKHEGKAKLDLRLSEMADEEVDKIILRKGMESIKQGTSKLLIGTTNQILYQLADPLSKANLAGKTPSMVVRETLEMLIERTNWNDYEQFKMAKRYKANVKNVTVLEYVAKLTARKDPNLPDDGDRFNYVVTKPIKSYSLTGELTRGSDRLSFKWEPYSVAVDKKLPIDRAYYLSKTIAMTLAQIIGYTFETEEIAALDDDKEWHKKISALSRKNIEDQIKELLHENDDRLGAIAYWKMIKNDPKLVKVTCLFEVGGYPEFPNVSVEKLISMDPEMIFRWLPANITAPVVLHSKNCTLEGLEETTVNVDFTQAREILANWRAILLDLRSKKGEIVLDGYEVIQKALADLAVLKNIKSCWVYLMRC